AREGSQARMPEQASRMPQARSHAQQDRFLEFSSQVGATENEDTLTKALLIVGRQARVGRTKGVQSPTLAAEPHQAPAHLLAGPANRPLDSLGASSKPRPRPSRVGRGFGAVRWRRVRENW